jgi:hypothetical protein
MDDPAFVCVLERSRDVAQDAQHVRQADCMRFVESRSQRLALDERHRVEGQTVHVSGGEQLDDARLLKRRGELDLPLESFGVDARGEIRGEQFDDDFSSESYLLGDENARHSAATELALDDVTVAESRLKLLAKLIGGTVQRRAELIGRQIQPRERRRKDVCADEPTYLARLCGDMRAGSSQSAPSVPCSK